MFHTLLLILLKQIIISYNFYIIDIKSYFLIGTSKEY